MSSPQRRIPPVFAVIMGLLPGVGRITRIDHVAECVQALASVAAGAPPPAVLVAGLPSAVDPARVVAAIKRHSPRSRVVLLVELSLPSISFAAFTAGADLVLGKLLDPSQVSSAVRAGTRGADP
jgi:DNA-binding NarL/FixJ family response regulator